MKKLFISCPMKDRTKEAIEESFNTMHKIAEIMQGEKLEVIQSYIEDDPPEGVNEHIWYLGKSIIKLAEADYFIGIDYGGVLKGSNLYSMCEVESILARNYNIPTVELNYRTLKCFDDLWKTKRNATEDEGE